MSVEVSDLMSINKIPNQVEDVFISGEDANRAFYTQPVMHPHGKGAHAEMFPERDVRTFLKPAA